MYISIVYTCTSEEPLLINLIFFISTVCTLVRNSLERSAQSQASSELTLRKHQTLCGVTLSPKLIYSRWQAQVGTMFYWENFSIIKIDIRVNIIHLRSSQEV